MKRAEKIRYDDKETERWIPLNRGELEHELGSDLRYGYGEFVMIYHSLLNKFGSVIRRCNDASTHNKNFGLPIMTVITTTFDWLAAYMPIPDGVPTNFELKQHVVVEFQRVLLRWFLFGAVVWMRFFLIILRIIYPCRAHGWDIENARNHIPTTRNVTRMLSGVRFEKHSPHSV